MEAGKVRSFSSWVRISWLGGDIHHQAWWRVALPWALFDGFLSFKQPTKQRCLSLEGFIREPIRRDPICMTSNLLTFNIQVRKPF